MASNPAAGNNVGVHGETVRLFVRAAIGCERASESRPERLASMAAVAAGIRNDPHLDRSQCPVGFCSQLHMRRHLMARGCADELFLPRELPFYRRARLYQRQDPQIFGSHPLLTD